MSSPEKDFLGNLSLMCSPEKDFLVILVHQKLCQKLLKQISRLAWEVNSCTRHWRKQIRGGIDFRKWIGYGLCRIWSLFDWDDCWLFRDRSGRNLTGFRAGMRRSNGNLRFWQFQRWGRLFRLRRRSSCWSANIALLISSCLLNEFLVKSAKQLQIWKL